MFWMNKIHQFILTCMVLSLAGCTTVRLAVYDFQKKHATSLENQSKEMATAETASESFSKERLAKQALTDKASKYIGIRYQYGSCDASKGFDCSGLVYHCAKAQEVLLPRSSHLMAGSGTHIPWKKAEAGDLIFFGDAQRINHVGIVEKNKGNEIWIIHSTSSNGVVRENILVSDYWKSRAMFAIDIFTGNKA